MDTLLLRFAAPMQAWGSSAKFDKRGTEREPTKSGVIGMLAAALGWRRDRTLDALNDRLRFGVRVDREGELLTDLQIAKSSKNMFPTYREYLGDEKKVHAAYLTYRDYLCDAVFLVGLEGDIVLLSQLSQALQNPMFPLFLGRRACPPEGKLVLGIARNLDLETALSQHQSLNTREQKDGKKQVRLVVEKRILSSDTYVQRDIPISFNPARREYGTRFVEERLIYLSEAALDQNDLTFDTEIDYFEQI